MACRICDVQPLNLINILLSLLLLPSRILASLPISDLATLANSPV
ncbi:hypothetical protein C942_01025 [Photobacterium marinum]|uniref:Uncharacterized protein n=1 Tax=Photobacterium marinum TaxID=1056511 RepID=L8J9P1_9GAMM|nr:hypothetical protein C942_01025 [Photobacterium marinum]